MSREPGAVQPTQRLYADELPFAVHQAVAPLDWPTRKKLLKKAKEEELRVSAVRQEVRLLRRRTVGEGQGQLKGRYRVIYADPPWPYDDSGVIYGANRREAYGKAERHYPTMPIEDIAAVPIEAHAQEHAALFLWCPEPLRFEVKPVIEAWGFTHKSAFVWDKVDHNYGHYLSVRHEHLLICTRGSCRPDRQVPMLDSVQTFRRSDVHSEKPKEFRKMIERLYNPPYLELFARHVVDGWTTYGNQVGALVA